MSISFIVTRYTVAIPHSLNIYFNLFVKINPQIILVPVIYTDVHKEIFVTFICDFTPPLIQAISIFWNNFDPLLTFHYICLFIFHIFTPAVSVFLQHILTLIVLMWRIG